MSTQVLKALEKSLGPEVFPNTCFFACLYKDNRMRILLKPPLWGLEKHFVIKYMNISD